MERVIRGILFFALTWLVITFLTIFFHYMFFRPEDYENGFIIFIIEFFETDLITILIVWSILTIFTVIAYFIIKSSD